MVSVSELNTYRWRFKEEIFWGKEEEVRKEKRNVERRNVEGKY